MKNPLKESGDTFRQIVRQYTDLYRNSELSRLDREQYFQWLQSNADKLSSKLKDKIEKKVKEKQSQKNEVSGTSVGSGGEGISSPFAFSVRGGGNTRAATSSTDFELVKPIKRSPNTLNVENQMYSEPAFVSPAQNIEPVDTYQDEYGLVQHGDPGLDPGLGRGQSELPMYESRMNNWYKKINNIIEGISGFKYLKTEADNVQQPPSDQTPPAAVPSSPPPAQQSKPQPTTQVVDYEFQDDFTKFDKTLKNSTEQLKVNFQKTIQNKILNKKVVIRASKGVNQPESDYTVNVTGVNIDYFYDRYVVVIIGREENKRKTSKFLLKSGFKIKILGNADLNPKDKKQVEKSKAVVGSGDQGGTTNVVTSKEPLPSKPKPTDSSSGSTNQTQYSETPAAAPAGTTA